jgi:hypothetical protein
VLAYLSKSLQLCCFRNSCGRETALDKLVKNLATRRLCGMASSFDLPRRQVDDIRRPSSPSHIMTTTSKYAVYAVAAWRSERVFNKRENCARGMRLTAKGTRLRKKSPVKLSVTGVSLELRDRLAALSCGVYMTPKTFTAQCKRESPSTLVRCIMTGFANLPPCCTRLRPSRNNFCRAEVCSRSTSNSC